MKCCAMVGIAFIVLVSASCATGGRYVEPSEETPYAILLPWDSRDGKYVWVRGIDLFDVPRYRGPQRSPGVIQAVADLQDVNKTKALRLSPGSHRILIRTCDAFRSPKKPHLLPFPTSFDSGLACGQAIVRLDAEAGEVYKAMGWISETQDVIQVWIEEPKTGAVIVAPVESILQ